MNLGRLSDLFARPPDPAPQATEADPALSDRTHVTDLPADPPAQADPDPGPRYHGFTLAELRTAAGGDFGAIDADPEALQSLALLLRTRAQRARGELPPHYTRPALCAVCGPVWLWPPGPARVLACPWCVDPPPAGIEIPRPPVRCGTCLHFEANATDPAAGIGACRALAPASREPPDLTPEARRPCGAWREKTPTPEVDCNE
jgi:hypothetical protein